MKERILITGASSGIGLEMARQLTAMHYDLILVARNESILRELQETLQKKYGCDISYFVADLSNKVEVLGLYEKISGSGLQVTMLVNNAGSGLYGEFIDTDLNTELRMIDLNISAVVMLTKLFAQDMIVRKKGRIMNVASLLAFLPFPYYSVYSATKSFILSFSETLSAELEGTGVELTTLCPGPVDTAFNSEAMWKTKAYRSNPPVSAERVAREGVKLLLTGKGKKITGFNNWFISNLPRITPDSLMMKIKKSLASQQPHGVSL